MSTTTTDASVEETGVEPEQQAGSDAGAGENATGQPAGSEAAKYRRRLRETETERDSLAARLETTQRREVESLVADTLKVPSALWSSGVTLTDLLGEDANVDPAKVADAAASAMASLGLEKPSRAPRPDPSQGAHGIAPAPADWSSVLRRR